MTGASTLTLGSGLTLSYLEQGERSGPTLVLLPGPTDSSLSYKPVLDLISPKIRTIAVSQRGHGDSDKPLSGYRVENFATDLVELLDVLKIERAVLVGHSGSCFTARRMAIDQPDRIAGLVLESSPTTLREEADLKRFVRSVVSNLTDPIDTDFVRSFTIDTSSGEIGPEFLDEMIDEQIKVPAHVWREMFAELIHYDDIDELGRIVAPTLLIWGDADGVVGREMQEVLQKQIARSELVTYPGAGHTPRWEDPSRFASDVTAFVRRCFPPQP